MPEIEITEFKDRHGHGYVMDITRGMAHADLKSWIEEYVEGEYYIDYVMNRICFANEHDAVAFRFMSASFVQNSHSASHDVLHHVTI